MTSCFSHFAPCLLILLAVLLPLPASTYYVYDTDSDIDVGTTHVVNCTCINLTKESVMDNVVRAFDVGGPSAF